MQDTEEKVICRTCGEDIGNELGDYDSPPPQESIKCMSVPGLKMHMISCEYTCLLISSHHTGWRLCERDGGEPEDNSFYRDWSFVPKAILAAYALGVADGKRVK